MRREGEGEKEQERRIRREGAEWNELNGRRRREGAEEKEQERRSRRLFSVFLLLPKKILSTKLSLFLGSNPMYILFYG